MKYFDAHTHVNFVAYNDDRVATIQRAKDAGFVPVTFGVEVLRVDTAAAAVAGFIKFYYENR